MRGGPRSARLLHGRRQPATPPYRHRGVVGVTGVGPRTWAELNRQPRRAIGRAPVSAGPTPSQRRQLTRRTWAWRLLLAGWCILTGLVAWAGLRWAGPASLGCPGLMVAALLLLAAVARSDLRDYERELRTGR